MTTAQGHVCLLVAEHLDRPPGDDAARANRDAVRAVVAELNSIELDGLVALLVALATGSIMTLTTLQGVDPHAVLDAWVRAIDSSGPPGPEQPPPPP